MATPEDVTFVKNAIHSPHDPRHFMRVVPAHRSWAASVNGRVVARSDAAVVVKEVGHDIYDPVVYFPRADVEMDALVRVDKSTHCPLKGDTEYFDIDTGAGVAHESAWSYVEMVLGDELKDLVAFDMSQVEVS
jgi:uncharacterized protein (DUF427 family)